MESKPSKLQKEEKKQEEEPPQPHVAVSHNHDEILMEFTYANNHEKKS